MSISKALERKPIMYSLDTIRPLVIEILRSEPDNKFGYDIGVPCQYWDYDRKCPDCIIGRLLARLGLSVQAHVPYNQNHEQFQFITSLTGLFEPDANMFLARVQKNQDAAVPWGQVADMIESGKITGE